MTSFPIAPPGHLRPVMAGAGPGPLTAWYTTLDLGPPWVCKTGPGPLRPGCVPYVSPSPLQHPLPPEVTP